jgi:hypothetical protein
LARLAAVSLAIAGIAPTAQADGPTHRSQAIFSAPAKVTEPTDVLFLSEDARPLEVDVKVLIETNASIDNNLNLQCPSELSGKQFKCTIEPVIKPSDPLSPYANHLVTGVIEIHLCLFTSRLIRDDCSELVQSSDDYEAQHKQVLTDVPLGQVTQIVIPLLAFQYDLGLELVAPGGGATLSWEKSNSQPLKKKLTVKVRGTKTITYGQTTSFSISTWPRVSATCKVYRFNGTYRLVATVKLTKGIGQGRHRWLWSNKNRTTAITLTARCETAKLAGTGYLIVTAYPKS